MSKKLAITLVPKTSWGSNLRSELPKQQWDQIRKAAYKAAGHRCEICGERGPRHPVEAHEVWEYDDKTRTQKLVRIEALCPNCHGVRHFGRSQAVGKGEKALRHLMKVNKWSRDRAMNHVEEAFRTWHMRSEHPWTLDLTWLEEPQETPPKDKGFDITWLN